jgi:histidinol phosphatase-like enzyme
MFHPLLEDPSTLKDQELENKILDLSKKYHISLRMGQGGVANQILIALQMYKENQFIRQQELIKNTIKKQGPEIDDLINVDQ